MKQEVELIWITPNAEQVIVDCARVSNPANQGKEGSKLLKYLVKHKHWSPFEMASMCVSIKTTRDISRQIIRHRSFSFQELSQRYMALDSSMFYDRECRLQDQDNRQNSVATDDPDVKALFMNLQDGVRRLSLESYKKALDNGIAKEQARALLPEGMTGSHLYMSGTIRSWLHYVDVRDGNGTQKEHIEIAKMIKEIMQDQIPFIKGLL